MAAEDYKARDTELVLVPGTYAYVLDGTKGNISVCCGPYKTSLSNTDQLVTYDPASMRFVPTERQNQAIQTNVVCPKGCYVRLENPSSRQPEAGKNELLQIGTLEYGRTENIPGPQSFPLWPGQVATVVKGHHLRSNQYLMVRVYDDEAAQANWDKSVVKRVNTDEHATSSDSVLGIDKTTLVTGQQIVIKGTDVAFYIPPTGVEVLVETSNNYVRDAETLERLEYAILLGEDGEKEYKIGPDVVFPTPTQRFFTRTGQSIDGTSQLRRKFRAFELQPTNGIHIKVIADYEEPVEGGEPIKHYAGEELFITGQDTPIYYPREEHATMTYGGNEKSYAVAIPAGEGRYVLDRKSGDIKLVTGPSMFLPNPIKEVIVRRILNDTECSLYYPGNMEVLRLNRALAENGVDVASDPATMNAAIARNFTPSRREIERMSADSHGNSLNNFADQFTRSTAYTPPRMITLNTKFDGAVQINVWSGFAVQIVNSKGKRRTVIGPKIVLLEYDENLERLSLSKGKPKDNDSRLETPYLRYISNPVSDIISLKTQDLVNVDVQVKYLVRFEEAESNNWFSVDNYVQYMVDHLRSLIGNAVRNISVQEFYTNATNILRDVVLGKKTESEQRPLKHFTENGMTVYDLELIAVDVKDKVIAELLARSRQETLQEVIALDRAKDKTDFIAGTQEALRTQMQEQAQTEALRLTIEHATAEQEAANDLVEVENQNAKQILVHRGQEEATTIKQKIEELLLSIRKNERDLEASYKDADSQRQITLEREFALAHKTRMEAVSPSLVEAIVSMAQTGALDSMAEHLAPLALVRGESLSGTLEQIFAGTSLEGMVHNLQGLSKVGKAKAIASR